MAEETETADGDAPEIPAMGHFRVPDVADLPEDLQERMEAETERAGFTPNVFRSYAYKPSHFRGFFTYYDALVEDAAITRTEIEMLIVTVSGVNHCYYCNVAHGALLRLYGDDPYLADQLVANWRAADVSDKHLVMLDVAVKLTEEPASVDEGDLERLRQAGYSEEEVWDIGSVVAFFNLSNRMAIFTDNKPNAEFHTMGR